MAGQKKIPMRMCVSCREMKPKTDLMRIVCTKEGEISFDGTSRKNGRGAYICRSEKCIASAKKTDAIGRAFEIKTPDGIYDKLLTEVQTDER